MTQTMHLPAARPEARAGRRRWWSLLVIVLGELLMVMDVTVVNVALPSIQGALHASADGRQWVITAYTLAFAGLLLPAGHIAGRIGHKRAFLVALAGFAAASAGSPARRRACRCWWRPAPCRAASGRCWPPLPWR